MASDVSVTTKPKQVIRKCTLDENGCVSLLDILNSFNAPINEEHAWALCFQCAECFKSAVESDKNKCVLVDSVDQVFVSKEGTVHPKTLLATAENAEEEVDLNAALVLGDTAVLKLIPKEGPRAKFLSRRKFYLDTHSISTLHTEHQPVTYSSIVTLCDISASVSTSTLLMSPVHDTTGEVLDNVMVEVVEVQPTAPAPTPTPGNYCTNKDPPLTVRNNASKPSKKRKVCTEYINEIDTLLDQSIEGQLVLAFYKKEGKLCNSSRDQLLTYFSRFRRANKLVVAGRLVVKYHNLRRKLISVGLIEKPSLEEELRVEEGIDYVDVDLEEDEDVRWLSANSRPWTDVLSVWERTFVTRMRLVRGLKSKKPVPEGEDHLDDVITSVPGYINYFRALTTSHGWELFVQDFNSIHPGKGQALSASWPKIIAFAKGRLPARSVQFLANQELTYDQKATELLLMLNQLFKVRNVTTPKGTWRVSRLEVQRSFVLHVETDAAWKSVINDRRECLAKQGLTLQPYLVFIGKLNAIKTYKLVYSDKAWWDFDSPLQALDVAFKAFFATDTAYPDECRHIWTFMQQCVYDMSLPADFKTDKPLKAYLAADVMEFSNIQV
ncbi:hypothetical protein FOCC_FOCC000515 [Frankliniella occidentalis]|nr:hypothetical protein FOCC_FOCC000515 [Frankliniella occidentalis]